MISADDLYKTLTGAIKLLKIKNKRILLSFMGVGEPFLGVNLIFEVYNKLKYEYNYKGVALSTMMFSTKPVDYIIEKVKKTRTPLKIHFSLHSPIDSNRKSIIPNANASVEDCLKALVRYREFISGDRKILKNLSYFHSSSNSPIEIHYTVIEKVNDGEEELNKMIEYGKKYRIPIKLLKFNPTKLLKRSKKEKHWLERLSKEYNADVCLYCPPGPNIGSSCGQFTKHYYLGSNKGRELQEFEKWKNKYEVT